jgi:transcriptional regulator with XRE-family HTH domain
MPNETVSYPPDSDTVAARIRTRRRALDLTQTQVAERLGVTQSAVALWERGETQPRLDLLRGLAEILDLPVEQLVP